MAYTTDRTWVTGEVVTAALMNTYVRDNIKWLSTDKPMARAYASAAVSHLTSGTSQALTLNTNRFDNGSIHSTTTNTERFTVASGAAGKWVYGAYIIFAAPATAQQASAAVGLGGTANLLANTAAPLDTFWGLAVSSVAMYDVIATNYFCTVGFQVSGGALNMNANSAGWAMWVGV